MMVWGRECIWVVLYDMHLNGESDNGRVNHIIKYLLASQQDIIELDERQL